MRVSQATLRHIFERHKDLVRALGIVSLEELKDEIMLIMQNPDEVHVDISRSDVKYYLKKLDDVWAMVILVGGDVKTAYLIGLKSYKRFEGRRWYRHY
ncbi:MAG: hypothetical protein ACP5LQ_08385 [Candidatus Methanodesulfokora sp.]